MRQENYLIALFNKELLDLRVPLPAAIQQLLGGRPKLGPEGEGKGKMLTRALEWNLRFCLMEFLFDPQGRVRKVFLKSKNRRALIEGCVLLPILSLSQYSFVDVRLRRRFIFMGILNAIFAPFIVLYLLMYSFFRYFEVCLFYTSVVDITDILHLGVPQESFIYWRTSLYSIRSMEIPRIQRTPTFVHEKTGRELSDG